MATARASRDRRPSRTEMKRRFGVEVGALAFDRNISVAEARRRIAEEKVKRLGLSTVGP